MSAAVEVQSADNCRLPGLLTPAPVRSHNQLPALNAQSNSNPSSKTVSRSSPCPSKTAYKEILEVRRCTIKGCPVDASLDASKKRVKCRTCKSQVNPVCLLACYKCGNAKCIFCHLKVISNRKSTRKACLQCKPAIAYTPYQIRNLRMVYKEHKNQLEHRDDMSLSTDGSSDSDDEATLKGFKPLTNKEFSTESTSATPTTQSFRERKGCEAGRSQLHMHPDKTNDI